MRLDDDVIVKLKLFHVVNQYFCSQRKSIFSSCGPTIEFGSTRVSFGGGGGGLD